MGNRWFLCLAGASRCGGAACQAITGISKIETYPVCRATCWGGYIIGPTSDPDSMCGEMGGS